MKKLIILLIIAIPIMAKSQSMNQRWMYISRSDDNRILLVDTIRADIKQDEKGSYYPTHTVTFWIMWYKKSVNNKKKTIIKLIEKIIADTVNNKYQTSTTVEYKNNVVVHSDDMTYDWSDVIPGTMAEEFIKFAKAVNNPTSWTEMLITSWYNKKNYPPLSQAE